MKLHVILCSTRPARLGPLVGAWFLDQAETHGQFDVQRVDLAEVGLPMFDEPRHPRLGNYEHEHTKRWGALIDAADAFVFVTPEYNFGPPPSLVNALDFVSREWAYKPVGFVSYGGVSAGTRSVQMTKQIVTALKMVPLVEAVAIPFFQQHVDAKLQTFDPGDVQANAARLMLDELVRWAKALAPLRAPAPEAGR